MLRHQVTLTSPLPVPAARAALLTWMQMIGYRLTSPPFLSSVTAVRGAFLQSMLVPDPSKWNVGFSANFTKLESGCEIEMEWNISTLLQIGLVPDMQFWTYEIWRTMGVVVGGSTDPRTYHQNAKKVRTGNTWRLSLITVVSVVAWIFIWYQSDSVLIGTLAFVVVLTGLAFAFKASRELNVEMPPTPPPPPSPPPVASSSYMAAPPSASSVVASAPPPIQSEKLADSIERPPL